MFGLDDLARVGEAFGTGGLSEFTKSNPFGVDKSILLPAGMAAAGVAMGNPGLVAGGASIYSAEQQARSVQAANEANIELAREQMLFSAAQARSQMDFQERMSSTAIRRAQADMLAAGINPSLAPLAQESSPGGAMGSYNRADVEPVPAVSMTALNSAKDLIATYAQVKSIQADIANTNADTALKLKNLPFVGQQTAESAAGTSAKAARSRADQLANEITNRQLAVERGAPKFWGWVDALFSRLPFVHSGASAARSAAGLLKD